MAIKRPLFKSQTTAWLVGATLAFAGMYCLHDAFSRRGQSPPFALKVFTPGM
jgi:hypothetical protein